MGQEIVTHLTCDVCGHEEVVRQGEKRKGNWDTLDYSDKFLTCNPGCKETYQMIERQAREEYSTRIEAELRRHRRANYGS